MPPVRTVSAATRRCFCRTATAGALASAPGFAWWHFARAESLAMQGVFPGTDWARKRPAEVGLDEQQL